MRLPCWRVLLPVFLAIIATGGTAGAQLRQANIQSLAAVETALTGAAVRDLEFGTATPGVPQTVAPQNAQSCAGCASGLWVFSNLSSSNSPSVRYIRVTFLSLPATLTGPGSASLPLDWTNGARGCVVRNGAELGCATGTPVQGAGYSYQINGPGADAALQPGTTGRNLYLYLGGTANPATSQRAGIYSGTVTIRFEYTNF
jgi:hypothetical protein